MIASNIQPDPLLDYLREGDTVVVASLDRQSRSLSGIIRTVEHGRSAP